MSQADLTIHTDGASRGNPGAAAFAYVIAQGDQPPIEESGCLGRMTNNQAEYTALVRALEHALRLGAHHRLVVHSDSELMVKQMNGEYRVKDPGLRSLYERASDLSERFEQRPRFVHVRRALNSRADALCNEALDGRRPPTPPAEEAAPLAETPRGHDRGALDTRAVACLSAAAASWARGNPSEPTPESVWAQLQAILREESPRSAPPA